MKATSYFCTAEWHLKRCMGDHITVAALLYPFALAISQESGRFYCSGQRLAKYFDCNPTTIYNAIAFLEYLEFFEYVATMVDGRKIYEVLSHGEWAKRNPGRCAIKAVKPKNSPAVAIVRRDEPVHDAMVN